jgi:hypothetical protein
MQYEVYLQKKSEDERNGIKQTDHSEEELLNMIKQAREKDHRRANGG